MHTIINLYTATFQETKICTDGVIIHGLGTHTLDSFEQLGQIQANYPFVGLGHQSLHVKWS